MPMRCPICSTERTEKAPSGVAPFCSPRCKTIDLGQWLGEGYRIPDERVDVSEHDVELPS